MEQLNLFLRNKTKREAIYGSACQPMTGLAFVLLETTTPTEQELNDMMNLIAQMQPWFLLKIERNDLLRRTDVFMVKDYPQTIEQLNEWINYREILRNLPEVLYNSNLELTFENYKNYIPEPPYDIELLTN